MHEWALAESIIAAALEAAEKEKLKTITEIKINIGELQQIEQDIFEFALGEIKKTQNDRLKQVNITIKTEKSTLKCKNCEHSWSFDDIKKKLLWKRENRATAYDDDDEGWYDENESDLAMYEIEYIEGLISAKNVAEEDVELALSLVL